MDEKDKSTIRYWTERRESEILELFRPKAARVARFALEGIEHYLDRYAAAGENDKAIKECKKLVKGRRRMLRKVPAELRGRPVDDHPLMLATQLRMAWFLLDAGRQDEARVMFDDIRERSWLSREPVGSDPLRLFVWLSVTKDRQDDIDRVLDELQSDLRFKDANLGSDSSASIDACGLLGDVYHQLGQIDKALETVRRLLLAFERATAIDRQVLVRDAIERLALGVATSMATEHSWHGEYDRAVEEFQETLRLTEEHVGGGSLASAALGRALATVYRLSGRYRESYAMSERARRIYKKHDLPPDDLRLIRLSNEDAEFFYQTRQPHRAWRKTDADKNESPEST